MLVLLLKMFVTVESIWRQPDYKHKENDKLRALRSSEYLKTHRGIKTLTRARLPRLIPPCSVPGDMRPLDQPPGRTCELGTHFLVYFCCIFWIFGIVCWGHICSPHISRRMHSKSCLRPPCEPRYEHICKTCGFCKDRFGDLEHLEHLYILIYVYLIMSILIDIYIYIYIY